MLPWRKQTPVCSQRLIESPEESADSQPFSSLDQSSNLSYFLGKSIVITESNYARLQAESGSFPYYVRHQGSDFRMPTLVKPPKTRLECVTGKGDCSKPMTLVCETVRKMGAGHSDSFLALLRTAPGLFFGLVR